MKIEPVRPPESFRSSKWPDTQAKDWQKTIKEQDELHERANSDEQEKPLKLSWKSRINEAAPLTSPSFLMMATRKNKQYLRSHLDVLDWSLVQVARITRKSKTSNSPV
jgi:hypothetical protein